MRLLAAVFDGSLMSYRWCSECCAAMAANWTDNGDAWTARARLGRESSNVEFSGTPAALSPEAPLERRVGDRVTAEKER